MSWLPVYNSWVVFAAVLSFFLWKVWGVLLFLGALVFALSYLVGEVLKSEYRYPLAFWLFIVSEVMIFVSLFSALCWVDDLGETRISDFMELPLLGSFLLLSSSISATAYHHYMGSGVSRYFLMISIFLGTCFVLMQVWEFSDCECDLLHDTYDAVCFCTIGLHCSHVVAGLVGLMLVLILGIQRVGMFYVDVAVWYWHFVDYIWLWVFLLVYVV